MEPAKVPLTVARWRATRTGKIRSGYQNTNPNKLTMMLYKEQELP
jgi:hypothetical protein